jgi:hypothetical protein
MRWAVTAAFMAVVGAAALFSSSPAAVATDGTAVLAGSPNTATTGTLITNTTYPAPGCPSVPYSNSGLIGCGQSGVDGIGSVYGVTAVGPDTGVYATSDGTGVRGFAPELGIEGVSTTGTGVFGWNNASIGIGVHGRTGGTGSGVYGEATTNGAGVFGDTVNGTGVQARSINGKALRVLGRVELSRSGLATVPAGQASIVINNVALTAKSMVLVTVQKHLAGISIEAAVPKPSTSSIAIYLNQSAGSKVPVAWMIIEMP